MSGALHIFAPAPVQKLLVRGNCPDCKKASRFLRFAYEWLGVDSTCLRCGREWKDGEWMPLPFVRGARKKNIEAVKRYWRKLAPTPSINHKESNG